MADHPDPRPLTGYAALLGTYAVGTTLATLGLRKRAATARRVDTRRFILLALATQHLSRLIAVDSISAPLRAPFMSFVEATGEGEVREAVIGTGLRHAIGELISCPYCIGQWVATGLVAGTVGAPALTEAVTTVCALARVSDWLQLAYDRIKNSE